MRGEYDKVLERERDGPLLCTEERKRLTKVTGRVVGARWRGGRQPGRIYAHVILS